jgi:integral membrane protein
LNAAVTRYRVMAYIVGVLLIVLVFVGIPLQVFAHQDVIVNYVGTTHGILYIVYLVAAYSLTRRLKLTLGQTLIVLLAGTIPVLTFIVERWVTRRFINPAMRAAGTAAAPGAAHQAAQAIESSESTGAAQEA